MNITSSGAFLTMSAGSQVTIDGIAYNLQATTLDLFGATATDQAPVQGGFDDPATHDSDNVMTHAQMYGFIPGASHGYGQMQLSGTLVVDRPANVMECATCGTPLGAATFSGPISWGTTTTQVGGPLCIVCTWRSTPFTLHASCSPLTSGTCSLSWSGNLTVPTPTAVGETLFATGQVNWNGIVMNVDLAGRTHTDGGPFCLDGSGDTADGRHFALMGTLQISANTASGDLTVAQTPVQSAPGSSGQTVCYNT
jgi:hypothetical protein